MENFPDNIKLLAKRVKKIKESVLTEEATKTSLIMPFFQLLNYDVFNPEEFVPEYTADVGIKKGEKVDYAILKDGQPIILIEAKSILEPLDKHDSQLFRYFGTTSAKFAILTNGIHYRFYTDLEQQNKMDKDPFFEFNLLEIRDNQINELYKFRKENFDLESILSTASELKYTNEIKQYLNRELENPSDEFVAFVLTGIYPGKKTKQVLDRFNSLVKKSFKQLISDILNDRLKAAIEDPSEDKSATASHKISDIGQEEVVLDDTPQIVTTEEEIEGYVTVKLMVQDIISPERIQYRDNLSYCNVLIDNNIRKWICRLGFNSSSKYIQFNDDDRTTVNIEKPSDIQQFQKKLIEITNKFI